MFFWGKFILFYTQKIKVKNFIVAVIFKHFLCFSFFVFPLFNVFVVLLAILFLFSCYMNLYYHFLGVLHLFGDSFFMFKENTLEHLKEPLQTTSSSNNDFYIKCSCKYSSILNSKNPPWNLLSFVSGIVINEFLKNSVRNCFGFGLILNYC